MTTNSAEYNRKKQFVDGTLRAAFREAQPHLDVSYATGEEIHLSASERRVYNILPKDEYLVVACTNGYRYILNVTANSLCSIAEVLFREMSCK